MLPLAVLVLLPLPVLTVVMLVVLLLLVALLLQMFHRMLFRRRYSLSIVLLFCSARWDISFSRYIRILELCMCLLGGFMKVRTVTCWDLRMLRDLSCEGFSVLLRRLLRLHGLTKFGYLCACAFAIGMGCAFVRHFVAGSGFSVAVCMPQLRFKGIFRLGDGLLMGTVGKGSFSAGLAGTLVMAGVICDDSLALNGYAGLRCCGFSEVRVFSHLGSPCVLAHVVDTGMASIGGNLAGSHCLAILRFGLLLLEEGNRLSVCLRADTVVELRPRDLSCCGEFVLRMCFLPGGVVAHRLGVRERSRIYLKDCVRYPLLLRGFWGVISLCRCCVFPRSLIDIAPECLVPSFHVAGCGGVVSVRAIGLIDAPGINMRQRSVAHLSLPFLCAVVAGVEARAMPHHELALMGIVGMLICRRGGSLLGRLRYWLDARAALLPIGSRIFWGRRTRPRLRHGPA